MWAGEPPSLLPASSGRILVAVEALVRRKKMSTRSGLYMIPSQTQSMMLRPVMTPHLRRGEERTSAQPEVIDRPWREKRADRRGAEDTGPESGA